MATELTTDQWSEILLRPELTNQTDLKIFQALYSFDEHKAYASQVGSLLAYQGKAPHAPLNSEIGRYAKRIAKYFDIQFSERSLKKYKYWDLFFNGWNEGRYFVWQLRPEIAQALKDCKLTGERPYAEELVAQEGFSFNEGARRTITVNAYERSPNARNLCIAHWGSLCQVCEFDFERMYGEIGSGFIHVHHLVPLSEVGVTYQVDPVKDLSPVCPNCHAMLHSCSPPLSIEALRRLIYKNRDES